MEWILLLWLSGNLVSELSNVGGGSGLGIVKILILVLAAIAIAIHILAFLLPAIYLTDLDNDGKLHFARTMLYLVCCFLFVLSAFFSHGGRTGGQQNAKRNETPIILIFFFGFAVWIFRG